MNTAAFAAVLVSITNAAVLAQAPRPRTVDRTRAVLTQMKEMVAEVDFEDTRFEKIGGVRSSRPRGQ